MALIIKTLFRGHEELGYTFVRQYHRDLFPWLIDLDHFNLRRRDLIAVIEAIRRALRDQKQEPTDRVRLVASALVTGTTHSHGARCHSVVGNECFGVATRTSLPSIPVGR